MLRRRRWHGIQIFINICGLIIIAAVVLVSGVSLRHRNRVWQGNGLTFSSSDEVEDTLILKLNQTELIASEIRKARQFKQRRPKKFKATDGQISPYDTLFKKYAAEIGWDWRLVAAISYVESHFKPDVVSPSGAKGLMQLMPRTAGNYGCPDSLMNDPEQSIRAGTLLLADLEKRLRRKNIDNDVVYFSLAGFHAGLGHIYDAIVLADSLGFDPTLWHENVERCLQLKADPNYYKLPYIRLGRFNGKITSVYIQEVMGYYEAFKSAAK